MKENNLHVAVKNIVDLMEKTQYVERDIESLIPKTDVITKEDLRKLPIDKSKRYQSTSGSTGVPLIVQKTLPQLLWYRATNIRELLWRKWDVTKNLAVVEARTDKIEIIPWDINPLIFPKTGNVYVHPTEGNLQKWIDEIPCEYFFAFPSIVNSLDTSKFIDIKSSGGRGGTNYSCTEVGTIAIQCPDNPAFYHVMENIVVEILNGDDIVVTDLTHPDIKRYAIGDKGSFGVCTCGRKLQTLKFDILGRVREMAVSPTDGSRYWPIFGSTMFAKLVPNLHQFQIVQKSVTDILMKVHGPLTEQDFEILLSILKEKMGDRYNFRFEQVGFVSGKNAEFVCEI